MGNLWSKFGLALLLAVPVVDGCSGKTSSTSPGGSGGFAEVRLEETSPADAVVRDVRRRFHVATGSPTAPLSWTSALGDAEAEGFEGVATGWRPRFAATRTTPVGARAIVELPHRADESLTLTDEKSGMSVRVRVLESRDALGAASGGYMVYRDALDGGGTIIHRPTATGTEDFVMFDEDPLFSTLRYELELDDVAGLRAGQGIVEMLDGVGTPRLRVTAPYLVDAEGTVHALDIEVEGCTVDSSPVAPWNRFVTPPGADACTIVVSWDAGPVAYPALLDPSWSTTGAMIADHASGDVSFLADGRAIAAGVYVPLPNAGAQTPFAELYDPATNTWAFTAPLTGHNVIANTAGDGTVLFSGRLVVDQVDNYSYSVDPARYDPTTGLWSYPSPVGLNLSDQSAVALSDGRILSIGGQHYAYTGGIWGENATVRVFDPVTATITGVSPMAHARVEPSATLLNDGSVLVAGPTSPPAAITAERWDPVTDTWSSATPPPMASFELSTLPDGRVLAVEPGASSTAALYDPATDIWSTGPR